MRLVAKTNLSARESDLAEDVPIVRSCKREYLIQLMQKFQLVPIT